MEELDVAINELLAKDDVRLQFEVEPLLNQKLLDVCNYIGRMCIKIYIVKWYGYVHWLQ